MTFQRENNSEKTVAKRIGKKKLDLMQIFYCVGNLMKSM